jgi:hypothetical protein
VEAQMLNAWATQIYKDLDTKYSSVRADAERVAQSEMEIAGGLSAIAASRTDAGFTNAVFAMCDPARRVVGTAEVETAANVQAGQGISTQLHKSGRSWQCSRVSRIP